MKATVTSGVPKARVSDIRRDLRQPSFKKEKKKPFWIG